MTNKSILDLEDDAASVIWGESWRMPTKEEWEELIDNCTWTKVSLHGVVGYNVTSRKSGYTDKFIFLPAPDSRDDTSLYFPGSTGYYWPSSLNTDDQRYAYYLNLDPDGVHTDFYLRYYGLSVRPVSE